MQAVLRGARNAKSLEGQNAGLLAKRSSHGAKVFLIAGDGTPPCGVTRFGKHGLWVFRGVTGDVAPTQHHGTGVHRLLVVDASKLNEKSDGVPVPVRGGQCVLGGHFLAGARQDLQQP